MQGHADNPAIPPNDYHVAYDAQGGDAFTAEALMWGGFLYTAVVSQLVLWPAAWVLCKLPILNRVL